MTHGDKTKAKTVKSSKASGQQKDGDEGSKAGKTVAEKNGNGKTGPSKESVVQAGSKTSPKESSKAGGSKAGESREAGAPKSIAEKNRVSSSKESRSEKRGRPAAPAANSGPFSNPVLADVFSRAIEKYPNAFRKLTD
jgi:hypothetical protein